MTNQSSNSACLKYEVVLEDYLEGQLSASDSKDLGAHLAACTGCRDALALAEDSVRLLRVAEPVPSPGPQFARVVMARIRMDESARAEESVGFWRPLVSLVEICSLRSFRSRVTSDLRCRRKWNLGTGYYDRESDRS